MLPGSAKTMMHRINKSHSIRLLSSLILIYLLLTTHLLQAQAINTGRPPSFLSAGTLQVTIGYFDQKDIPGSVSGCSESYAFDTLSFRLHKLALFSDLNSILLLKINGQLLHFHISKAETKDKTMITDFSGHGYTGRLISKAVKKIDFTHWVYSAILELYSNGKKKTLNLLGYYGC